MLLRKDLVLSSCARDLVLKPLLSAGHQAWAVKSEIDEWQDLMLDTYFRLKEDSSMRQAYDGASPDRNTGAQGSQVS